MNKTLSKSTKPHFWALVNHQGIFSKNHTSTLSEVKIHNQLKITETIQIRLTYMEKLLAFQIKNQYLLKRYFCIFKLQLLSIIVQSRLKVLHDEQPHIRLDNFFNATFSFKARFTYAPYTLFQHFHLNSVFYLFSFEKKNFHIARESK